MPLPSPRAVPATHPLDARVAAPASIRSGARAAARVFGLALTLLLVACAGARQTAARPGSPCDVPVAFEPWDLPPAAASTVAPPPAIAPGASKGGLADALLSRYQRSLRRPEVGAAGGCPFDPSCSHFARQAFSRYGPLAVLFVLDRLLIREHPLAASQYVARCVSGRWRWHDPLP